MQEEEEKLAETWISPCKRVALYLGDCEAILPVLAKSQARHESAVITDPPYGSRVHITQKPVELMAWCVTKTKSKIIIDPYMGSGSTGVAALRVGRSFIGIERDENHYKVALERIREAVREEQFLCGEASHEP